MNWLLLILGVIAILVALLDMVWTTLAVSGGAGFVTARLSHWSWEAARRIAGHGGAQHRALRIAGVTIVVAMFVMWVMLIWLGWTLVFASHPDAVVSSGEMQPESFIGRAYFAGYSVFTLGTGDAVSGFGMWRILTIIATFTGLGVVTMGITYLVPVTGAVTERRTMSLHLGALGTTPHEVVLRSWTGDGFDAHLEDRLRSVTPELMSVGQLHLAYPVLHYFHDLDQRASAAVAVPVFDEALTLLEHGVAPEARPSRPSIVAARDGVASLLSTLTAAYIEASDEVPEPPSLEPLREAGIPTVSDEEYRAACRTIDRRRAALHGLTIDDGWTWDSLYSNREDDEAQAARDAIAPEALEDGA